MKPLVLFFTSVCGLISIQAASAQTTKESPAPMRAIAVLHPTEGNNTHGTISFREVADGVRVEGEITGLTPGKHGFHVHEFGDCSARDASSAGGHFNPTNQPHGAPDSHERHVGDMGNVDADSSGMATVNYLDHVLSFVGTKSIIGRAVIVHAKADDFKSQPSGEAGERVACGVIGWSPSK